LEAIQSIGDLPRALRHLRPTGAMDVPFYAARYDLTVPMVVFGKVDQV
jgi:hypothetical protein